MSYYKIILDTKFVGISKVVIIARNDTEAIKRAEKMQNEYNTVKKIIRLKEEV